MDGYVDWLQVETRGRMPEVVGAWSAMFTDEGPRGIVKKTKEVDPAGAALLMGVAALRRLHWRRILRRAGPSFKFNASNNQQTDGKIPADSPSPRGSAGERGQGKHGFSFRRTPIVKLDSKGGNHRDARSSSATCAGG